MHLFDRCIWTWNWTWPTLTQHNYKHQTSKVPLESRAQDTCLFTRTKIICKHSLIHKCCSSISFVIKLNKIPLYIFCTLKNMRVYNCLSNDLLLWLIQIFIVLSVTWETFWTKFKQIHVSCKLKEKCCQWYFVLL